MTGNQTRRLFLDYFEKHHHRIVRSSSLVPQDDPTLLFTNAGMVQFKRTFLGEEKRDYVRAASSQKCVRAGGKHNDLENVGYTARHHTFFEMLGNFSFGDYFKEKAIEFAWDLLINGYKLPVDKLWVSVYLDDDEAHDLWHQTVGVAEDRIVRFGEKDNFWSMGDTGPCGPCSEIMIDRGESFGCGRPECRVGCDCDRYLEIWNLVFMQFNRDESGRMTPLPRPSIDTGMGLERIVSVVQDVPTNYDTDLILPILQKAETLSGKRRGQSAETDVAMKVIADHSRSAAFLVGDGVLPSNEGRGYVLRRILRRAIRYGRQIGLTQPFLHETVKTVFDIMKPAYPELADASAFITSVIHNEEVRFSETLDHGLKLLNETLADIRTRGLLKVPGDVVFKLYDTYGFPVDIVRDVVRDQNLEVDMAGFEAAMTGQREKSRSVASFSTLGDAYKSLSSRGILPEFVGYDSLSCKSEILLIVQNGKQVNRAEAGAQVEVVTAATPFYGESGGQTGDRGMISGPDFQVAVSETVKDPTGLIIHKGKVASGAIELNRRVTLSVDKEARAATACNHTATHILQSALRQILGDHVKQAGSMVSSDRLRFDFTHFAQVDADTLNRIETLVNARIRENAPTGVEVMAAEKAFKTGATALFEEKYGDWVRVISLADFSKELCGGTHTRRTGDIGFFKIVSESSVASGVRRIEAVTGAQAVSHAQSCSGMLNRIAQQVREKPDQLPSRIDRLMTDQKSLEKELERLKARMAAIEAKSAGDELLMIQGVKVLVKKVAADNPASLRNMADQFRDRIGSGIVVLAASAGSKAMLVAAVTKDLTDKYQAGAIVKHAAAVVGGSGGGRPDMAQAGGTMPEKIDEALERVRRILEQWPQ